MRIYNTLTQKKEEFVPLTEGVVGIYACGPTVYDYFHIGNARPFIIFDVLRRYLTHLGYDVVFVQNFTDIDDKMINRANHEGISVAELADRFIKEYYTDARGLNILEATHHPKATEHIDAIIDIIQKLIDKGFAYVVDGDVYFSTKKFAEYGKLSHQPLDDLEAGARISVDERKADAMDFVLWKSKKEGEPAWKSPWGEGRPGWHIECSAMANKYLGDTIDIHCGGRDLIFPHHENEIAQSECALGKPFARYWMHNAYINIDNKKMSKSEHNFFTVRDISREYDYEVIRFFILSAHYQSPLNFARKLVDQAKTSLERIYTCIDSLKFLSQNASGSVGENEREIMESNYVKKFEDAMDDDLNTANAISEIFNFVRDINTVIADGTAHSKAFIDYCLDTFDIFGDVLGLFNKKSASVDDKITMLIEQRKDARERRDFALADKIRDDLAQHGIMIEDTPNGPKYRKI